MGTRQSASLIIGERSTKLLFVNSEGFLLGHGTSPIGTGESMQSALRLSQLRFTALAGVVPP